MAVCVKTVRFRDTKLRPLSDAVKHRRAIHFQRLLNRAQQPRVHLPRRQISRDAPVQFGEQRERLPPLPQFAVHAREHRVGLDRLPGQFVEALLEVGVLRLRVVAAHDEKTHSTPVQSSACALPPIGAISTPE